MAQSRRKTPWRSYSAVNTPSEGREMRPRSVETSVEGTCLRRTGHARPPQSLRMCRGATADVSTMPWQSLLEQHGSGGKKGNKALPKLQGNPCASEGASGSPPNDILPSNATPKHLAWKERQCAFQRTDISPQCGTVDGVKTYNLDDPLVADRHGSVASLLMPENLRAGSHIAAIHPYVWPNSAACSDVAFLGRR